MIDINNYIIEKLRINKDTSTSNDVEVFLNNTIEEIIKTNSSFSFIHHFAVLKTSFGLKVILTDMKDKLKGNLRASFKEKLDTSLLTNGFKYYRGVFNNEDSNSDLMIDYYEDN